MNVDATAMSGLAQPFPLLSPVWGEMWVGRVGFLDFEEKLPCGDTQKSELFSNLGMTALRQTRFFIIFVTIYCRSTIDQDYYLIRQPVVAQGSERVSSHFSNSRAGFSFCRFTIRNLLHFWLCGPNRRFIRDIEFLCLEQLENSKHLACQGQGWPTGKFETV